MRNSISDIGIKYTWWVYFHSLNTSIC